MNYVMIISKDIQASSMRHLRTHIAIIQTEVEKIRGARRLINNKKLQ